MLVDVRNLDGIVTIPVSDKIIKGDQKWLDNIEWSRSHSNDVNSFDGYDKNQSIIIYIKWKWL